MTKKPVALIILDGFGLRDETAGNAVQAAKMPNLDRLFHKYPHNTLEASGLGVGLPDGQMGNSEVGHLNLGAGRIVYQSLTRINLAVKNGDLKNDPVIEKGCAHALENNKKVHVMGLLSPGGIHSHNEHIYALVEAAKAQGAKEVYVHIFLDGRDTAPKSALEYVEALENKLTEIGIGKIATVSGRYYAMDRDKNYDRTQLTYDAMTQGTGEKFESAKAGVEASYKNDILDEFVVPFVVDANGLIQDGDTVIFANFRPDRAQQIAIALSNPENVASFAKEGKEALDPSKGPKDVYFISMMSYGDAVKGPVVFGLQDLANTYGEVISANGLKQLRIAETEKYAHVTFFFNGGRETPYDNEDRILVPSPKVATYDLKPEMSAYGVKDKLVEAIQTQKYDFIVVNYANGDMVGHTGIYEAIEKAVTAIDNCVKDTVEAAKANDYEVIIIADHGNADHALNEDGTPNTAHSLNPVPFVYVTANKEAKVENGVLADVAPSILHILGMAQPADMSGKDLIK